MNMRCEWNDLSVLFFPIAMSNADRFAAAGSVHFLVDNRVALSSFAIADAVVDKSISFVSSYFNVIRVFIQIL